MNALPTTTKNPTSPTMGDGGLTPMRWAKLRSGALFIIAALTNPCCTPLYVPLLLVLLAGTPVAVWAGAHLGWVYGGLTLVSLVSAVMAWRSWQRKHA